MSKRTVVSWKNLPTRMPLIFTAVCWLLLDRFDSPGWVWGVVGTLVVALWFVWIADVLQRDDAELFKDKGPNAR